MNEDPIDDRAAKIQELTRLRKIDELKQLRAQSSSDVTATPEQDPSDQAMGTAASALRGAGKAALGAVGKASEFVDKYNPLGAPGRAAAQTWQQGYSAGDAFDSFKKQYGEDPSKAPSSKQIMENAGLSGEETIPQPLIMNPWAKTQPKLSPAGIAGGAVDMATDPTSYIPFEKVGAGLLKGAKLGVEGAAATGRTVAPVVNKVINGIDTGVTKRYIADPARKAAAPLADDIERKMADGVIQSAADAEATAGRVKTSRQALDDAYKAKQADLGGKTTTLEEARGVMASLDNEKKVLGSLSKQADDALVRSGATFQRDHLLQLIDRAGKSIGQDIVSKGAKEAVANLQGIREIVAGLPDTIDAPRLRNIMRQVREDLNYNVGAGQFNSANNKVLKEITGGMSNALKESSPEYAAYMARMSTLADHLEDMASHFGSEGAALSSMESVRKGNAVKGQTSEDILRRYAEASGNKDIIAKLDKMKADRELAEAMKNTDLRQKLFPKEASQLAEHEAEQKMADEAFGKVKSITPQNAAGKAGKIGRGSASAFDKDAVDALSHQTGDNFPQQMQDRADYDAFDKDGTRGGRLTVAGTALGGAIGHRLGGGIGASSGVALGGNLGLVADRYGGKAMRGAINVGTSAKAGADKVISALQSSPQLLGKYRGMVANSVNKGAKAFQLDHHILMNNDPEYRRMVEGLTGEQQP